MGALSRMANKRQMRSQLELVATISRSYFELCSRNIELRDDFGKPKPMAGYEMGRYEGASCSQLHETAKMLRREVLKLDSMIGGR